MLILTLSIPIFVFSADTTVNSNTTWPAGTYTFGNVTVTNNSTLSCTGVSTTGVGVTINCDNLTIDAGSKISADSFGHSPSVGLGAPGGPNGAGYGGKGGLFYIVGRAYGSATQPTHLGSGGGGTAGGGSIIINCTGTVTVNGDITANAGTNPVSNWIGGASGGSVWITANTFAGSGRISANGSAPGIFNGTGSCGGGGRIAVHYTNNTSTCSFSATTYANNYAGAAGTVFLKKAGTNGIMTIDNAGYNSDISSVTPLGGYTFDTLIVKGKAKVEVPDGETLTVGYLVGNSLDTGTLIVRGNIVIASTAVLTDISINLYGNFSAMDTVTIGSNCCLYQYSLNQLNFNNLIIQNNGKILSGANTTSSQLYVVNISANNVTVDTGGQVNTDYMGFASGIGPGVGTVYSSGGYGGRGGVNQGMGGSEYGSIRYPAHIGSGGANGAGGGYIRLAVANSLINNGTITANGVMGGNGTGSGGGIYISSGILSGSGSITANGGTGSGYSSAGGGRIAVYYNTSNFSGVVSAYSGTAGSIGSAGTVFIKSAGQTNGDLTVNNSNLTVSVYTYLNESMTVDTLAIMKKGCLVIPAGKTLTVSSSVATNPDTGVIINKGTLNLPDNCALSNITIINDGGIINETGTLTISAGGHLLNTTGTVIIKGNTVIQTNAVFNNGNGTVSLQGDVTLSGGTLIISGNISNTGTIYVQNAGVLEQRTTNQLALNSVIIQNGGIARHGDNSSTQAYIINISANAFTIEPGGKIDVIGLGYDSSNGPGAGTGYSGGGYGGRGGVNSGMPGNVYGSITQPGELGSGGLNYNSGGGCVKLNVTTLTNNGTIIVDGSNANSQGVGSGGGIYISANTISGTGVISAKGGYASGYASGGGGRIALYYSTNNFTGDISANGGPTANAASAGTIYLKSSSQQYGDLIIDNKNVSPYNVQTEINSSYEFNNVTIKGRASVLVASGVTIKIHGSITGDTDRTKIATLQNKGAIIKDDTFSYSYLYVINEGGTISPANGIAIGDSGILELRSGTVFSVTNINIENGGLMTHTANTTYKQYFISVLTDYFNIRPGGVINVSGRGYSATYGPGYGWNSCGGSYGGKGGKGGNGGSSANTYGSETVPTDLGSGGSGGAGGGAVYIASKYLINDGIIISNGDYGNYWGGGSGGSIYVRSAYFSGAGQFTVKGARGWNGGPNNAGGGGGGRVAVYYYANNFSGTYDVSGANVAGESWDSGYPGTVYTVQAEFLLPPNQPEIITPSYGGAITNRRPAFTWIAPSDLESNKLQFEIEISGDINFGTTVTSGNTSDTITGFEYSADNGITWGAFPADGVASNNAPPIRVRYTVQNDLDDGSYYWRVRAKDIHGYSIWSTTGSLPSVMSEFSMRITAPADNTVTYEDNIVIEGWAYQTVANKMTYNDGDTRDMTLENNKFSEKVNLAVGTNKYTVVVYNKDGASKNETVNIRRIQLETKQEIGASGGKLELEDGDGNSANNSRIEIENGAITVKVNIEFRKTSKTESVYEINGYSGMLKKKAKITLRYDNNGLTEAEEKKMRIHWWDGLKWQAIGTEVDVANDVAVAYVSHFSKYAVMMSGEDKAKLLEIVPDMITPNNDGINDISSFNIIKDGLFDYELAIYDVEGRTVRRYEEKGVTGGLLTGWDGKDANGNVMESGLYICIFKIGDKRYIKTINVAK